MKLIRTINALWKRKRWVWPNLWELLFQKEVRTHGSGPIHVLFLLVDHFEPFYGNVYPTRQLERVEEWRARYPQTVEGFTDCEGRIPQYSWFYFGQEREHLKRLSELCFLGLGEIEMHIHHGPEDWISFQWKKWTRDGFWDLIEMQKNLFAEYGALITAEEHPRRTFGFIHGMFALDNSFWEDCGLRGELGLLKDLGCYADFTFPAPGKTQPSLINCHYYPLGESDREPSYYSGEILEKGTLTQDRLLIFQGPIGYLRKGFHFSFEDGLLAAGLPVTRERVHFWISRHIHVPGRPDWIFVKVYTHGTQEGNMDYLLGEPMIRLHTLLQEYCGPQTPYRLHYVTAREAYNIAMAAAAGKEDDPGRYRDFIIPPYANRMISSTQPYRLERYSPKAWAITMTDPGQSLLQVNGDVPVHLKADLLIRCQMDLQEGGSVRLQIEGKDRLEGRITLPKSFDPDTVPQVLEGKIEQEGYEEGQNYFRGLLSAQGALILIWRSKK